MQLTYVNSFNSQSTTIARVSLAMREEDWTHRMRRWMKDHDLTQQDVANKLDLSQGQIGHWLTGRNSISTRQLEKWCKLVGADPVYIFFGKRAIAPEDLSTIRKLSSLIGGDK